MAKIEVQDRVQRDQYVEARVTSKDVKPDGRPAHLEVYDLQEFAKKMEETGAPLHHPVTATIHDSGLIKSLRVDWHEDLINGEPAPQASPR